MNKSKVKKFSILLAIIVLPGVFYLSQYTGKHNFRKLPKSGPQQAIENADGTFDTLSHKIPYFDFTIQNGELVTSDDLLRSVYVADFFFATCPTICPKMTTNMGYVQRKIDDRDDLRFISITVNPEHDNVQVLKEYADKVHADTKNWDFLTGDKDKIYDIAFNGFFVSVGKDEVAPGGFLHSQFLILVDQNGHIRGLFDGTIHKVVKQDLIDAIDILLKEKYLSMKGEKKKDLVEQIK